MTHPLTPHEKVAALKTNDPTNPAHRLASDLQAGHFAFGEARYDLIEVLSNLPRYAALASSGDHAELVEDATEALQIIDAFPSNQGEVEGRITEKGDRLLASCTRDARLALEALIAEVAALREQLDWMTRDRNAVIVERDRADTMMQSADDRATEAERKLAEAVGVLRDLSSWFDGAAHNGVWIIRSGDLGADDAVCAARTFLSKEAERG